VKGKESTENHFNCTTALIISLPLHMVLQNSKPYDIITFKFDRQVHELSHFITDREQQRVYKNIIKIYLKYVCLSSVNSGIRSLFRPIAVPTK
jgi:hypothetical protein